MTVNVLAQMPTGVWRAFDNQARARAFNLPENYQRIFTSVDQLAKRLPLDDLKAEYVRMVGCQYSGEPAELPDIVWGLLQQTTPNPFIVNCETGEEIRQHNGKRASMVYEPLYDPSNAEHAAAFKGLPKQAKLCLLVIIELVEKHRHVGNDLLYKELYKRAVELKTKQDPWRVFKYYQAKLIELGLLRLGRR